MRCNWCSTYSRPDARNCCRICGQPVDTPVTYQRFIALLREVIGVERIRFIRRRNLGGQRKE